MEQAINWKDLAARAIMTGSLIIHHHPWSSVMFHHHQRTVGGQNIATKKQNLVRGLMG